MELNVFTPNIPPSTSHHYLQLADKHHLLVTGGSDCHGMNKGKPLIGSVKLPYQYVEKLKEKALEQRANSSASALRPSRSRIKPWDYSTNSRPACKKRTAGSRTKSSASSPARPN